MKDSTNAAMSRRRLPPSVGDEDAAHGLGSGGEEMSAVVPGVAARRAHQPGVRFMDQGGRLQRVARLLIKQPGGRSAIPGGYMHNSPAR